MKGTIIATLATAVLAMAAFWLVEGRGYISRSEAAVMIEKESPYIKDQNMILNRLTELIETNRELRTALYDLKTEVVELQTLMRKSDELHQTYNLLPETKIWARGSVLRTGISKP